MSAVDVAVRRVRTDADRDAAYAIRRRVFREEQGVPEELEFDDDDRVALHVLAENGGTPIGTARIVFRGDEAKVGRMAVLAEWRRHGVGRRLLEALVEEVRHRGIQRVVLHAQTRAVGFYEKLGFRVYGEEFEEAGIPHRAMARSVIGDR